ncbi:hypothetical protein QA648_36830 (plasmid) [Rhizobium sp. CB3171]|uniref:hypothetical protein n=1 Tax=Rhizobium sp. CB3171 TaxID=3039157 RepID=UPI0024B10569|nr:hypothetical protein [Rhizobium sp. CB3171]WFU07545.1 hypothetical protein QA648_36830 [Rhizobium sp. CB3171]
MSASENDDPYIETSLAEVKAALRVSTQRLERLFADSFLNRAGALASCLSLISTYGAEKAIRVLQGKEGSLARFLYYGPAQLFFGLDKARAAVRELPDAIAAHGQLLNRRDDLVRARKESVRNADAEHLRDQRLERPGSRKTGRGHDS